VKVIVLPNDLFYEKNNDDLDHLCTLKGRWMALVFISGILGVGCGLFGLLLSVTPYVGLSDYIAGIGHLGNWLIAFFIPLMILAAHALDKVGQIQKTIRINYCKKHGMRDEDC